LAAQLDLDAERARLAKEQADGHELKNAQTRGDLVSAEAVTREWVAIVSSARAAMLAVPSRCQTRSSTFGPAEVEIIDREVRDALEALSNDVEVDALHGAQGSEAATADEALGVD